MKGPSPWHLVGLAAVCREPISGTAAIVGAVATVASTAAGVAMQYAGSQRQAAVMRGQSQQADFAAEQERIRGFEQSNQLRESLLRTLASQRSRYAASGLVADEGTALSLQEQTAARAERELTIQDSNSTIRAEQQRSQASLLDDSADWTATGGTINAGVNLFSAFDRYAQRQAGTTKTVN